MENTNILMISTIMNYCPHCDGYSEISKKLDFILADWHRNSKTYLIGTNSQEVLNQIDEFNRIIGWRSPTIPIRTYMIYNSNNLENIKTPLQGFIDEEICSEIEIDGNLFRFHIQWNELMGQRSQFYIDSDKIVCSRFVAGRLFKNKYLWKKYFGIKTISVASIEIEFGSSIVSNFIKYGLKNCESNIKDEIVEFGEKEFAKIFKNKKDLYIVFKNSIAHHGWTYLTLAE